MSTVLAAVLVTIALVAGRGRPTGVVDVLVDLFALPSGVVPGYVRALRSVRNATLWGFVAGGLVATVVLIGLAEGGWTDPS